MRSDSREDQKARAVNVGDRDGNCARTSDTTRLLRQLIPMALNALSVRNARAIADVEHRPAPGCRLPA
jgi:hypothetical protein